jgi:chaperonin GroEL
MAIIYQTNEEARKSLASGVQQLAQLVTITLGPKGRNIALDRKWNPPMIVHDGVSVANAVELKDPFENMGAMLVKEAANKTADRAGDGTTTSTLLAWKIIEGGMKLIDSGSNPMIMKEGMDQAVEKIVHTLSSFARPIQDNDIENVATISAANPEIGKIIAEAMKHVGIDGVITVEEGTDQETVIEYKDGMMFDEGCDVPAFVTNEKEQSAEIEKPMILFTDMIIDSMQDLSDFLDNILTENDRNIVIVAHGFEGATLPLLVNNHKQGVIRALAIKAPFFGHKRIWMLEDMAALTGGTVITRQSGRTLASIKKEELGRADKVVADTLTTKIVGGKGTKEAIGQRIIAIKEQVKKEPSEFEKKQLKQRIAKLTGGAAIVKVGAKTEAELKDRKERIIDAVEATKSAVAEGIVAGGGIALLQCQDSNPLPTDSDPDIQAGMRLVYSVLSEPIKKILQNAGKTPEIILNNINETRRLLISERDTGNDHGYNVATNGYGNMFAMGVIDPLRVTRQALENAVSVSSMILTTEGLITFEPENSPENPLLPAN